MPELPEVETICRQLDKVLPGQRIKALQGCSLQVEGKRILGVKRKAKMIIIELSGEESLLIHLKMTGQLVYDENFQFSKSNFQTKYTRVIFELDKGKLLFNDLRRFGWIQLVQNEKLKAQMSKLPPDVVDKEFIPEYLEKVLKSSGRAIKLVLLDQSKMGGIGNIYANEILFCAGIDPRMPAQKLTNFQFSIFKLHKWIKKVIKRGIKYGGSTASDEKFVNAHGEAGKFQNHFQVYENKGRCNKCKTEIKKIKLGGRGTYFCPKCQR